MLISEAMYALRQSFPHHTVTVEMRVQSLSPDLNAGSDPAILYFVTVQDHGANVLSQRHSRKLISAVKAVHDDLHSQFDDPSVTYEMDAMYRDIGGQE